MREWVLVWLKEVHIVRENISPLLLKIWQQRWNLLLVAPKEGHRVAFEQVVEFNKQMMNDSKSLTAGTIKQIGEMKLEAV